MLLDLLLILETIIGVLLIGVVLLQQSEGGVLGVGGGPSGFMTARGAGNLMTRVTWILGASFFALALILTILAGREKGSASVVDRLKVDAINPATLNQPKPQPAPAAPGAPTPGQAAPAGQPLSAPAPTLHNPFLGDQPAQPAPALPAQK